MGIQKDAGELLLYAYKKHKDGEMVNGNEFKEESEWADIKTRNALYYLTDKGLVKAKFFIGGGFLVQRLFPQGIDIVENQEKFKVNFGFNVNLGVLSFSWNKQQQ